jgi:biotin carboxyl carrier protein
MSERCYVVIGPDGEPAEVKVSREENGMFRVVRDGVTHSLDVCNLPGAAVHMLVGDGKSYDASVEWANDASDPFDGRVNVAVLGRVYSFDVLDKRRVRMRDAVGDSSATAAGSCRAPMPGKVLRVLVAPGDTVVAGQGLVVVEAMKMENELTALGDGVVEGIHVTADENVEKGCLLVTVTPAEAS